MARPASQAKARAKELGLSRYRELTPCKYGHNSERYTKTGICVACTKARKSWNREPKTAPYGPFITQEQAQAAGLKHFYNGQACKNGHVGLKYANGSGCVVCAVERANGWKGRNREKTRESGRIYNKTKRNNAKELAARESNPRSRAAARIRSLLKNTIVAYGGRKACKTRGSAGVFGGRSACLAGVSLPAWHVLGKSWGVAHRSRETLRVI